MMHKLFFVVHITVATLFSIGTVQAADTTTGLVSHFALDARDMLSVHDLSPSRLLPANHDAKPNQGAFEFDGQSQFISVASDQAFEFDIDAPFTLAARVRPVPRPGNYQAIMATAVSTCTSPPSITNRRLSPL